MALQFNDTTTYNGLIQKYEREIGANRGDVSGNTDRLKEVTVDINLAVDSYMRLAFPAEGKWKLDDSNHTDLPEITTNLVANQRTYLFDTDENGNVILDIYKVYVLSNGVYVEIDPVDPDSEDSLTTIYDGQDTTGTPTKYDKLANGLRLDIVPGSNVTDGLKVSISRAGSYFTYTDTTKKPGFPSLHHSYFYLQPAYEYARINTLSSLPRIERDLMVLERQIKQHFTRRSRDERPTLHINRESTK